MKVLLIKLSSLGDLIHTLPAISDAHRHIDDLTLDWLVDESMQAIPKMHRDIHEVIPAPIRQWKKNKWSLATFKSYRQLKKRLQQSSYDIVIDAQGLLKSAWLSRLVKAERCGFDRKTARESLAALFYHHRYHLPDSLHAVERIRQLFAKALHTPYPQTVLDFGIETTALHEPSEKPAILFFHGTTWDNKEWPQDYWVQLAKHCTENGWQVKLAWGSAREKARSEAIAKACEACSILPPLDLPGLTKAIYNATLIVSVDTGLGHLSTALSTPAIALFGPTDPNRVGLLGEHQVNLQSTFPCAPCLKRQCQFSGNKTVTPPCFESVSPSLVWENIKALLDHLGKTP